MPTLQLIITDAGRQAIVDAGNTSTLPLILSEIGVGSGTWSPNATATQLQNEIKRLQTVGGLAVAADTMHVTITDASSDAYALGEFGIYTDGGVLFAIYSDPAGITDKAADALLLLAADVVLVSIDPASIAIGSTEFTNPPATETVPGVAKIATQGMVDAGVDDQAFVTSLKLAVRLAAALALKQPLDPTLTALAGLATVADKLIYATGADQFATSTLTAFMRTLLDDADAATARTTLGAQQSDATLTALASVATAADKIIYATGADQFATSTLTAFMRTLLDDVDATTARTTIGAQQSDATLTALASVATAADKIIYATGVDQFATSTLTAFMRTLLDDVDATTARATLGIVDAIGDGQTWQNMTASRTTGVIYTNTTGRPIQLYITGGTDADFNFYLDSLGPINHSAYAGNAHVFTIIPAGSTYKVVMINGGISLWYELR